MKFILTLFIFAICSSTNSFANTKKLFQLGLDGVVNGGGGIGVRCGNNVKLLDLYEASLNGYPPPITSGNFDNDLKIYANKAYQQFALPGFDIDNPDYQENNLSAAYKMLHHIIDIPSDQSLAFTEDATLPQLPNGCSFVQIAINHIKYDLSSVQITIYRDKELWNLMSPVDQVALTIHEFIYSSVRIFDGELNSDDTRVLIGKMFSHLETYALYSPIQNSKPVVRCSFLGSQQISNRLIYSQFYAAPEVENGISGIGFYFFGINSKILTSRTRAFIPNISTELILNSTAFNLISTVRNFLLNKFWKMEIKSNPQTNQLLMRVTDKNSGSSAEFLTGSCTLFSKP